MAAPVKPEPKPSSTVLLVILLLAVMLPITYLVLFYGTAADKNGENNGAPIAPPPDIRLDDKSRAALRRGLEFLMSRQGLDGAWRGEVNPALQDGAHATALALSVITELPEAMRAEYRGHLERAAEYLLSCRQTDGGIGTAAGDVDMTALTTALTVRAVARGGFQSWHHQSRKLIDFLKSQQCVEEQDVNAKDPLYGGWSAGQGNGALPDVHATAEIVCCLRAGGVNPENTMLRRAIQFLAASQCAATDAALQGGAGIAPVNVAVPSPAGTVTVNEKILPRPYAAATADVVRAAARIQSPRREDVLRAADAWLRTMTATGDWRRDPGYSVDAPGAASSRFALARSWADAMSETAPAWAEAPRAALLKHLLDTQGADGEWRNADGGAIESDPVVATAYALSALLDCARQPVK